MKLFASIAMLALTLGLTIPAAAQENNPPGGKRAARMEQFRTDLETAISNSTLTEEKKAALRKDFDTVRAAAQARRTGGSFDKDAAQSAWQNIRGTLNSDAIRPEDREKLQADMKQLRKRGARKRNAGNP